MESFASSSSSTQFSSYNSSEQNLMNSYFKNMPQFDGNYTDVDDEMASKEKRFETFKDWPNSSPLSPMDLANAGFYYTGVGDQVRCFSCDLQLKEWLRGDDPFVEHRKLKPDCNFVVESERERCGVTCVGETASSHSGNTAYRRHEQQPHLSQNNQYQHQPTFSNYPLPRDPEYLSAYTGIRSGIEQQPCYEEQQVPVSEEPLPYWLSNPSHITNSSGVFVTSQYPSLNRPVLQTPGHFTASMRPYLGRPGNFEQSRIRAPQASYAGMHRQLPGCQESIPPQSNQHQVRRVDIPVQNPVLQHLPNVHVRTEDSHHTTSQTDLQNIHKRLSTFIDWPEDCPVRPWELITAGFHYLGTGDNVKCYKCNVALRNWEPDDTPWAEHKRWSPTCPLVKEHEEGKHTSIPVEDQEQPTETMYHRIPPAQPRAQAISRPVPTEEQEPLTEKNVSVLEKEQKTFDQLYEHSTHTRDPISPSNEMREVPLYEVQGWEPSTSQSFNQNQAIHPVPGLPQNTQHRNPDTTPVNPLPGFAINQGSDDSLDDRDFMRAMEMGFSREDIDKVIAKQTERTGKGFAKLDELMQALLDDSESETAQTSSLSEQSSSFSSDLYDPQLTESQPSQPRYNATWSSNAQSFSFEQNEPSCSKRALKRSNSAPPSSSSVLSNPSESGQRELEQMREERLICKICMDAEVGVVFLPCGHISCCPNCASGLDMCPMCRKPIQQVVRTFLS